MGQSFFTDCGGFLTGEVKRAEECPQDDFRHNDPRYQDQNYYDNVQAAQTVRDIATAKGVQPGQNDGFSYSRWRRRWKCSVTRAGWNWQILSG
ncbi:hypothetical protein ACUN9V_00235 [Salinicola sp. V024]|uniref:hypothetical protein n=1 Tax=Salinicola sp. V024 TaxID=3459609 RepID=UPI004043A43B